MSKVTGIVVVFEDGEFALPDLNEVEIVDKASGKPLFNVTGDINSGYGCPESRPGIELVSSRTS